MKLIAIEKLIQEGIAGKNFQIAVDDVKTLSLLVSALKYQYGGKYQLVELKDHELIPVETPRFPEPTFRELIAKMEVKEECH